MKASERVTGGDVITLMTMPFGSVWKERALIAIRAENRAQKDIDARERRKTLSKR